MALEANKKMLTDMVKAGLRNKSTKQATFSTGADMFDSAKKAAHKIFEKTDNLYMQKNLRFKRSQDKFETPSEVSHTQIRL